MFNICSKNIEKEVFIKMKGYWWIAIYLVLILLMQDYWVVGSNSTLVWGIIPAWFLYQIILCVALFVLNYFFMVTFWKESEDE
jgi:hypothetical protein